MIEKIMHNWVWKILSLLLGAIIWLAVVNYDDPYIKRSFENIAVEKRYTETIKEKDMAVTYLDGETVDVVVGGSRSKIDKMTASDISAYVNMNRVSITNTIDIVLDVEDGIDIVEKTPNSMQISLEQIKTEIKAVQVISTGELEEDYITLTPIITPNQVELTGPESKLAMVASVIVEVKIDGAENDITVFVSPQIQDSDGQIVNDLKVNKNQIEVKVPIQKIKTIPIQYTTVGELDSDYRLISMTLQTKNVTVRGEGNVIDEVNKLVVDNIDLSQLTDQSKQIDINLENYLPEGVILYKSDALVTLDMDIRPLIDKELTLTSEDVTVKSLDDRMSFNFVDELNIPIVVRGIHNELDVLAVEDLKPTISLKGLEVGQQSVKLEVTLPPTISLISELPDIMVELVEATDEAEVEADAEGDTTTETGTTTDAVTND